MGDRMEVGARVGAHPSLYLWKKIVFPYLVFFLLLVLHVGALYATFFSLCRAFSLCADLFTTFFSMWGGGAFLSLWAAFLRLAPLPCKIFCGTHEYRYGIAPH